jgi:hypothetical protein
MGQGMSLNILKFLLSSSNGGQFEPTLVVYNRDTAKSERFVGLGKVKQCVGKDLGNDLQKLRGLSAATVSLMRGAANVRRTCACVCRVHHWQKPHMSLASKLTL